MESVKNQDEMLDVLHQYQLRLTRNANCTIAAYTDGTTTFQVERYGKVSVTVFRSDWDEYRTNNELEKMRRELGL